MLIETFIPNPDAIETHQIEIAAAREAVYQSLWTTDLGGSPVIKGLMALRSLPGLLLKPARLRRPPQMLFHDYLIEEQQGRSRRLKQREKMKGNSYGRSATIGGKI